MCFRYLIGKELQNYPQDPLPLDEEDGSRSAKATDDSIHRSFATQDNDSPEGEVKSDNDSPMSIDSATERLPGSANASAGHRSSSSLKSDRAPHHARAHPFECGESKEAMRSSEVASELPPSATASHSPARGSPSVSCSLSERVQSSRSHSRRSSNSSSSSSSGDTGGCHAAVEPNPGTSTNEFRLDADALTFSVGTARPARPRHSGVGLDALSPDSRGGVLRSRGRRLT